MAKGYVVRWKQREKIQEKHITDMWFGSRPEHAAHWPTREDAEGDCVAFALWHITIPTADGATYCCKDFKVKEHAGGEFVVYCDAPFIVNPKSDATTNGVSTN